MRRANAKTLAPIIQAYGQGATIEHYTVAKGWRELNDPRFDSVPENYRIKPAPRTFWVNVYPSGSMLVHLSEESAYAELDGVRFNGRTIKVREVTDEG